MVHDARTVRRATRSHGEHRRGTLLPRHDAAIYRQRSLDHQRRNYAGGRRDHPPDGSSLEYHRPANPQRVRRDLAGRQQGIVHPQRRRKHGWSRRELSGLRPVPDGLERAVLLSNHQADLVHAARPVQSGPHSHRRQQRRQARVHDSDCRQRPSGQRARLRVYGTEPTRPGHDPDGLQTDAGFEIGRTDGQLRPGPWANRGRVRRPHAARSGKGARLMSETQILASYVRDSRLEDIPADVRHEARRALVNYVGCAVGGSLHPAVDLAIQALGPYSGPATASVLGRGERLDPLHASLMNGISSHVYDYDDTTPKNYSHPSSPVASALFAYASVHPVRGRDFIEAFILGFEAESRVANAVYPAHYDAGWHITGTSGVFGAATAVGKLLGLSVQEMVWAIGLAATQAAGLRERFGARD